MTAQDRMREPWWASGSGPDDGLDDSQDPFDAHHGARRGHDDPSDDGATRPGGDHEGEAGRLAADAIDLISRLAVEAGRRIHARSAANAASPPGDAFTRPDRRDGHDRPDGADTSASHANGEVCDACPICMGLRALRQARPDVITHLSDAAHHVSLALRALADAHAGDDPDGLEKIDLDQ